MERRYADHAGQYSLENSILQTEEMFRQAITEQKKCNKLIEKDNISSNFASFILRC